MRRPLCSTIVLLSIAACSETEAPPPTAPGKPAAPTALVYGVAAPLGAELTTKEAAKAAPLLTKLMGMPVTARVLGYDEAVAALAKGELDFALVPPLTFVKARRAAKIGAIRKAVFNGEGSYRSVIFVRADSKVKTMDDLKGKSVAFVAKGSMSGNLAPRGLLRDRGIDPATYFAKALELEDHEAVCNIVAAKKADAGASFANYAMRPEDLAHGGPDLANVKVDGCTAVLGPKAPALRTILLSEPIPNSIVAVRAGLPDDLAAKLADGLDELSKAEPGRAQLREAFGADGFLVAFADELDPVSRALDFDEGKTPAKTK